MPDQTTQVQGKQTKSDTAAVINVAKTDSGLNKSQTGEQKADYKPSEQQTARIKFVLTEYDDMLKKRNQTYVQFNDRTLLEFIDDSDKRLNAYVLDKASQGKEDWQANYATRAYANKAKALLAATARDIPDIDFKAVTKDDSYDYFAAEMMKDLTRYSYQKGNPTVDLFFLGWSLLGHGTVISYEGLQQHQFIKKRIKSFDLLTGDVDFEEVETKSYGEPVSFEIPLQNLLVKNFYIKDMQDQPACIWWSYYGNKDVFDFEWGKYPNSVYVKDAADIRKEESDTYFMLSWKEELTDNKGYLVLRYYNKYQDLYRVVANGVELYNGPMLWGDITSHDGQKVYPFAKEIFEPFAQGTFFFYGNSMVNSGMGEGDVINSLINSSLDKTYRSLVPPLLVGMVNKDMLDLEDEVVAGDTKIYVEDVSQVTQMKIAGISDSDIKMISLISDGFNLTTLDPSQQGQADRYVTARAAVAADERARQLKGVFFMFLESLWLQKTKLRVPNILLSYTQPQLVEVLGKEGEKMWEAKYRTLNVENTTLSDGTKGTLSIAFAGTKNDLQNMQPQIEQTEAQHQSQGKNFEQIGVMYDYLERFCYDVQVVPATLWQSSQALAMSLTLEKISTIFKLFPEYFAANKETFFREVLQRYDDTPEGYNYPKPLNVQEMQQLAQGQPPGGDAGAAAGAGAGGVASDITGTDSNNSLAKLTGVQQ